MNRVELIYLEAMRLRHRSVETCIAMLLMLLMAAPMVVAAEHPTLPQLQTVRDELVTHLDEQVLPFWTTEPGEEPLLDGFLMYQAAASEGKPLRPLIAQLRQRATTPARREALREAAARQLERLPKVFWDNQAGGWYHELDEHNQPVGKYPKPTVAQVYAIYVLAGLKDEVLREQSVNLAKRTFAVLDRSGWDPRFGGYVDHYTLPLNHSTNRYKQTGTNFHALQALTELYLATGDALHRQRLESLCRLATTYYTEPASQEAYVLLTRDWAPIDPANHPTACRTIYGHTAELVWYTLEGIEALNATATELASWAQTLAAGIMRYGMATDGPVYHYGQLGGDVQSQRADWWAQVEAMTMFLRLYELTGDPIYWQRFEALRQWTFQHMVSPDTGQWWQQANPTDQRLAMHNAGARWKAGLHVTRFLIRSEQILGRLETTYLQGNHDHE